MRRLIPFVSVCLLLTALAESAFAQQRLFAVMDREVVELDPRLPSLGTVIRRFPLPDIYYFGPSPKDVVPVGGGELLAWVDFFTSTGPAVALLNTRSGSVHAYTIPDFEPGRVVGTDGNARLLVLGRHATLGQAVLVADARSGSMRFLGVGPNSGFYPIAYAAAADVLFMARVGGIFADPRYEVDAIHASTGVLLKTLDIHPVFFDRLSTNDAGTRLFVTNGGNGTFVFDVLSGTLLASNTSDLALGRAIDPSRAFIPSPVLDEHRNRLITSIEPKWSIFGDAVGISAFSADTLALIGRTRAPELPTERGWLTQELDLSGQSATLFVLQAVSEPNLYHTPTCRTSQLIALHVDTGQVRRAVNTTDALGDGACRAKLIRITEPAAPSGLSASVAGHLVTLQWRPPFGATHYALEAGTAPGLANLATIPVRDTQLVVDGVPPGTYHLRVRAINTIGKSGASQDVQVVVP